ncbi:MAG: helix-turn-helix domain-containing protein [Candidatus Gastranaerophilales bacterium]|nr:helix-turn-helix domain-containing protein [Candidatus Gastranaerophilales bacterium]
MEDLLERLKELGFNSYEAKVYLSLLKHQPATGYEVSKESGVPQARAYDTLKVLENRQIVVSSGTKPVTYIPINPQELLNRCERSFKSSLQYLKDNLPTVSDDFVEPVHNIRGEQVILDRVIELINNAKRELFLEIWNEDVSLVKEVLKKAHDRGVDLKIVGYNDVDLDFGMVYQHGLGRTLETALGGRWIILSIDGEEGIVGTLSNKEKPPQVVWTRNRDIVLIIKEVIVHDIFLLDVESELGDALNKVYGKDLIKLREKILGKDFKIYAH